MEKKNFYFSDYLYPKHHDGIRKKFLPLFLKRFSSDANNHLHSYLSPKHNSNPTTRPHSMKNNHYKIVDGSLTNAKEFVYQFVCNLYSEWYFKFNNQTTERFNCRSNDFRIGKENWKQKCFLKNPKDFTNYETCLKRETKGLHRKRSITNHNLPDQLNKFKYLNRIVKKKSDFKKSQPSKLGLTMMRF